LTVYPYSYHYEPIWIFRRAAYGPCTVFC